MHNTETINNNNGFYYIQIDMVDGSMEILQISKEQAIDLGIDLSNETSGNVSNDKSFQLSSEKKQELAIGLPNIVDGGNVTEYRLLQPEDINLKLIKPKIRGIKRPNDTVYATNQTKNVKTVRTRSGRITMPPKHIQQLYKRILESNSDNQEQSNPVLLGDFKPLRTNGEAVPPLVPFGTAETKCGAPKRAGLSSQLRCATCNKAYIGKRNMIRHLKAFPDHRPKTNLNIADNKTWDCLIDTSKMAPAGGRGPKFCRELFNLLQNVKILAKYFFKLEEKLKTSDFVNKVDFTKNGQYLIDDLLAKVLEIDKGWYTFNEHQLCKDLSIFSFLENVDNSNLTALSINGSATDDYAEMTDHQTISSTEELIELLNIDENLPIEIEPNLNNKNKIVILSNVLIPPEIEISNQCKELLIPNNINKLKESDAILNCYEDKPAEIFSNFLNELSLERQNTTNAEKEENKKSINGSMEAIIQEVDLNFFLHENVQNAENKISKDLTISNISTNNLSDVKSDMSVEDSDSNTNFILGDNIT